METPLYISKEEELRENSKILSVSTLMVSSNTLVLKGITSMLRNVSEVNLLGQCSNKLDMMLMIYDLSPSLVLINDDEAGSDPPSILELIRLVRHEYPNLKVLILLNDIDIDVETKALKLGVRGILNGGFNKRDLTNCILHIVSGGLWIRREVMEKFITQQLSSCKYMENKDTDTKLSNFTRRELQIMQLASKGQKNREIGEKLYISEKTVKHHMSRIFKKLNISKRNQLKGLI